MALIINRLYSNEIAKQVAQGLVDPVNFRPFAPPWTVEEPQRKTLTPLPFTLVLDKRPTINRITTKRPYHTPSKTVQEEVSRLPSNMAKLHALGQSRSSLFAYSLSVLDAFDYKQGFFFRMTADF